MKKKNIIFTLIMVCALCVLSMFGSMNVSAAGKGAVCTVGVELSDADRDAINKKIGSVADTTGLDIVVYICKNLDATGKTSPQAAADDFYDDNGYGESGILFLWLVEEQTAHISTKGSGIRILYDNAQVNVWADIQNDIKSGNYASAFETFGDDVLMYFDEYNNANDAMRAAGPRYGLSGIIAVVAGALSGLIRSSILKGELKTVAVATNATDCIKKDSFKLTRSNDVFLYRTVERKKRTNASDDKSAATHTSSSGASHGGNTFK